MVNTSKYFTDSELQWFRGGAQVTHVLHVITEEDIISQESTCVHPALLWDKLVQEGLEREEYADMIQEG